jgi:hypothetical protein
MQKVNPKFIPRGTWCECSRRDSKFFNVNLRSDDISRSFVFHLLHCVHRVDARHCVRRRIWRRHGAHSRAAGTVCRAVR